MATSEDDLADRVRTGVLSREQAARIRASLDESGARMRAAAVAFAEAARPALEEFRLNVEAMQKSFSRWSEDRR